MLASVGLLVACQERVLTYDGAQGGTIHEQVLTADGADTYTFASTAGDIDVVALGTNTGQNMRAVMWPSDGPEDSDAESCATWSAASGDIVQMGAVLRARALPDGSVRAVTVTQNIWFYGTWICGAIGVTLVNGSASAATNPTTSTTTSSSSSAATPPAAPDGQASQGQPPRDRDSHDPSKGGHMANGITEEVLTGDAATKAKAAAEEAVSGGTVERVENDAEGATYEAHVTKADGSQVTVKMDASFKVTETVDGHG